jgi:protein-disulfide isomerase
MASRKEQKEQARARRLAEEQAAAAHSSRMRRIQMLIGVVIAAVVIVGVAIAISSSGSSAPAETGLKHGTLANKTYEQVNSLIGGIPQTGTTLGNPKAPVTLQYFGDLECPICQAFTLGAEGSGFPQLVQNEVRQGKVKVEYRSFCTATCNGPGQGVFNTQQVAAYAAGKQDLFWDFAELFYREQGQEDTGYVTAKYLNGLATQIPKLNLSQWQQDRKDPAYLAQVQADETAGSADGVTGTPTLIAVGPKGKEEVPGSGIPTYSDLQSAIKAVA